MQRALFILAAMLLALALVVAAIALLVGPFLESAGMRRMAEETVRNLTGFSCRIEAIRVELPFRLSARGVTLEGRAGGNTVHAYLERATALSGPAALARGRVDQIRVEVAEIEVHTPAARTGQRTAALRAPALEIPDWAWRIDSADVRVAVARVRSTGGSLCFEGLEAAWALGPEPRRAEVRIAVDDPRAAGNQMTLRVSPNGISALPGPLVLPDLDLEPLLGMAGIRLPAAGSLGGAAFPVSGPEGVEAVHFEISSEDLALQQAKGLTAGFSRGRLHLGSLFLLPRGPHDGIHLFVEGATASLTGLTVADAQLDPALEPLDLAGSLAFDTLSDRADWTLDARTSAEALRIRARGSLSGVRREARHLSATVHAGSGDLTGLANALPGRAELPEGARLKGEATLEAELEGDLESMQMKGSMRTSGLRISAGPFTAMPVGLDADLEGRLREGRTEQLGLEARRLTVGGLPARRASLAYGEEGATGSVAFDCLEAARLVSLLGPMLPPQLAGYDWGGEVRFSAGARIGPEAGSPIRGDFSAGLRDGRFGSPDYQRMGEGIDADLAGSFRVSPAGSPVHLDLTAELPRGEIVLGDLYGDLSRTRPRLEAGLRFDAERRSVQLRSSAFSLDNVGTVRLTGRLARGTDGIRGRTRIEAGPLLLDALLQRVLRDAAAGMYPGIEQMAASGSLEIAGDLVVEEGAYRARGRVQLEDASVEDPSKGLTADRIAVNLPFSLAAPSDSRSPGPAEADPVPPGSVHIEGIRFRGLEIPAVQVRLLLAQDSLTLVDPVHIRVADGSLRIPELSLGGLGSGRLTGRAIAALEGLDLEPLAEAVVGRAVEGRLSGEFHRIALEGGAWEAAGGLQLRIGNGGLRVEEIEIRSPIPGGPSGRFAVEARGIPLQAVARDFTEWPLDGTLDGELPEVRLSGGTIEADGALTLSVFGGTVKLSGMQAAGWPGPDPILQLDVDLKEIDLMALTSPIRFGRVSGVLQGRIQGLRIGTDFPYATAFDAELETVKRRGVPRKIDATAVENIARIAGSSQLANVLSAGLYRFFDEYHYRKMGIRAALEDGWLQLHGIPKGGKEHLIIRRRFRVPTVSMPITVATPNRKIRFNRWLSDIMRMGEGGKKGGS